jgi:hypothetical protein
MTTHIDIFELKTAADLFRKLEGDFAALKSSQDTRVAFNFFVTAEHLPDWLGRRGLVRQHAILRVVSHIANGAKHFTLDDRRHTSVSGTEKVRYVEEGYVEPGYFDEPLLIHLSPDEARELGASPIGAAELGRRVLEFWRPHVPKA